MGGLCAGNGGKRGHAFVAMVAMVSFLAGFFASPLASLLLKCDEKLPLALTAIASAGAGAGAGAGAPPQEPAPSTADLLQFRTKCSEPIAQSAVRRVVLERVFGGSSPFEGFPPAYAKGWVRQKRIKGWGSYGGVFERLVREVRPETILELGTFTGASAIHMANLSRGIMGREALILCVDDFRGWPGLREKFKFHQENGDVKLMYQFLQNAAAMGAEGSVVPLPFSTAAATAALCEWGVYADLVEVDAAHDFHSAWADINRGYALLRRPGGVLFGHDYFTKLDNRGVGRAVDLFAKLHALRVEPDGQHWILRAPS